MLEDTFESMEDGEEMEEEAEEEVDKILFEITAGERFVQLKPCFHRADRFTSLNMVIFAVTLPDVVDGTKKNHFVTSCTVFTSQFEVPCTMLLYYKMDTADH